MPSIGPLELFLVAAIGLIVFGPQKLPEIARNIGRTLADLRRMANEVKAEFEAELNVPEDDRVRPEGERPDPVRLTPEGLRDDEEVLKPGEPGPGDEPGGAAVGAESSAEPDGGAEPAPTTPIEVEAEAQAKVGPEPGGEKPREGDG